MRSATSTGEVWVSLGTKNGSLTLYCCSFTVEVLVDFAVEYASIAEITKM